MLKTTREDVAEQVKTVGEQLKTVRMTALEANMPFVGGILRAAEEALVLSYTLLNDENVENREL